MKGFKKHPEAGDSAIYIGSPRPPTSDMDVWYQTVLAEMSNAKKRAYLYGADAGLCARRNVLLEHNTWLPSEKSAASQAYMAIGVGLEDMLAQGLRRKDLLLDQGRRLITIPEVKISGKIDLIMFDAEENLCLTEVKTCGDLPAEPKPVHLAQIQMYAAVSGITRCWLTYISRNVRVDFGSKLAMRTFRVDTSQDILRHRFTVALISAELSRRGLLSPVPATFRKHTECHFCEFRDAFCWGSRPGLGGEPPRPPLPAVSPEDYIALERRSLLVADSLVSGEEIAKRRRLTLEGILSDEDITLSKKMRIKITTIL